MECRLSKCSHPRAECEGCQATVAQSGSNTSTMQVDARFADLSLGLVDASIVVLADELGMKRVAMRDIRHLGAVRLSN